MKVEYLCQQSDAPTETAGLPVGTTFTAVIRGKASLWVRTHYGVINLEDVRYSHSDYYPVMSDYRPRTVRIVVED